MGIVVVLVILVAVAIAALVVRREATRLSLAPRSPVFSEDEAFEWVVAELPDIVAATLTPADVRRILRFQSDYFEARRVTDTTARGTDPAVNDDDVVVDGADVERFVLERAAATGESYLPEQVEAVVVTQMRYLQEIGAVGPAASPDAIDGGAKPLE